MNLRVHRTAWIHARGRRVAWVDADAQEALPVTSLRPIIAVPP